MEDETQQKRQLLNRLERTVFMRKLKKMYLIILYILDQHHTDK